MCRRVAEHLLKVLQSEDFKREYDQLLRDYVGRPSPLYLAHRLSEKYGCRIYLKREDLNHTGAHKINNSIGQVLLARRMGKAPHHRRNRSRANTALPQPPSAP